MTETKEYCEFIIKDIDTGKKEGFTGNILFEVELGKDGIVRMDCFKNTSFKEDDVMGIIQKTLSTLKDNKFVGKVGFKVNLKSGGIANMNCTKYKMVKL